MNFIIDRTLPDKMRKTLKIYGYIYESATVGTEDKVISTHPDLQIHFVTDNLAFCAPETLTHYQKILPNNIILKAGTSCVGSTYPSNCAYNVARVGNIVICNTKCTDKTILDFYGKNGNTIINVNQGYSKCNICPISDSSFITEDKGIFNATKDIKEIRTYLITAGTVHLDGFEYGFIGGATGIYNKKLFACGKVADCIKEDMYNIIKNENIEYIELSDDKLRDFGSIIVF